jgi:hypothetical protein
MTFLKLKSFGAKMISAVEFPVEMQVIIDGRTHQLWIVVDGDGLTIIMWNQGNWQGFLRSPAAAVPSLTDSPLQHS